MLAKNTQQCTRQTSQPTSKCQHASYEEQLKAHFFTQLKPRNTKTVQRREADGARKKSINYRHHKLNKAECDFQHLTLGAILKHLC